MDLIQEEIEEQAKTFSKLLKIEGKTIRMDSLSVSFSCRKLSRLEIIYSTVLRLIKAIDKNTTLPEYFKPYLDENHYNDTIYHARDKDLNSKIKKVLKDGLKLYHLYRKNKEIKQTEEFKLLSRMLKEQTRKGIIKPSEEINKKAKAKGIKMIPINLVGDGNIGKESKGQDIMRGKK